MSCACGPDWVTTAERAICIRPPKRLLPQAVSRRLVQQRAEALVSRTDPGCYNQAMMDLGAMLCTRTTPKCEQCPVGEFCKASRQGNPLDYPVKAPAKPRRTALVHALLCVEIKEEEPWVWLVLRDEVQKGMGHWKGLWTLPETAHPRGVEVARIEHVMSHVTLTLAVHRAEVSELPPKAFAVPASRLTGGPLPAPIKKLLSTLLFDAQLF